jgi:hypothetical protein
MTVYTTLIYLGNSNRSASRFHSYIQLRDRVPPGKHHFPASNRRAVSCFGKEASLSFGTQHISDWSSYRSNEPKCCATSDRTSDAGRWRGRTTRSVGGYCDRLVSVTRASKMDCWAKHDVDNRKHFRAIYRWRSPSIFLGMLAGGLHTSVADV